MRLHPCQETGDERRICRLQRRKAPAPGLLHPGPGATSQHRRTLTTPRRQPRGPMIELIFFINYVINLYSYVVFAAVIMSFLLAFNVINPRNQIVQTIWTTLTALTEPLLGSDPPRAARLRRHRSVARGPSARSLLYSKRRADQPCPRGRLEPMSAGVWRPTETRDGRP